MQHTRPDAVGCSHHKTVQQWLSVFTLRHSPSAGVADTDRLTERSEMGEAHGSGYAGTCFDEPPKHPKNSSFNENSL